MPPLQHKTLTEKKRQNKLYRSASQPSGRTSEQTHPAAGKAQELLLQFYNYANLFVEAV